MEDLLTLATSDYSGVRTRAQDVLLRCSNQFSHSYKLLLPKLKELLTTRVDDDAVSHEQFKVG